MSTQPWEGHWCISHPSIRLMLGERLPVILEAFSQVKSTIQQYMQQPNSVDLKAFLEHHQAALVVALQVDALAQTSLQIDGDQVQLYSVINGEPVMRQASLIDVEDDFTQVTLRVRDAEDHEESVFQWEEGKLSTEDNGLTIHFGREVTTFFSDPELDVIERLLEMVQQSI